MDETDATTSQQLTTSTGTLASPSSLQTPLPTIPFELIPEILCRLPVKPLIQFKCVCKSWKSLISDPKFAKKHLRVSTACLDSHHVIVSGEVSLLWDSTIPSIFSDASTTSAVPQLQLIRPEAIDCSGNCVSSCDGILLFSTDQRLPLLWNPSTREFKILPSLLNPGPIDFGASDDEYDFDYDDFIDAVEVEYTFGYDHFIDNYKVFAVTFGDCNIEVSVYTLGADSWRRIDDFPNRGSIRGPGMFVNGSVNWLAVDALRSYSLVIVSLDLEEESYRKLLIPDLEKDHPTSLGVLRDCLCLFVNNVQFFDVWVMKEYGLKESWTKLFSVPYLRGHGDYIYTKVVYVYEDDQVLLDYKESPESDLKLVVYNSRNGTFKIPKIEKINDLMYPEIYVESLISPLNVRV